MAELTIQKYPQEIHYFAEPMPPGSDIFVKPLNMVLIMGGEFLMGSPKVEIDRRENESPQHQVTVPSFFMSEFPITQTHWATVAQWPKVKIDLKISPANFKGTDRPIETVSWHEAIEFCARFSKYTSRSYRLPSEAEWEYACRACTTTPFHFGETITTELANYRGIYNEVYEWSGSYGPGPTGEYLEEITPVNKFSPNAFGLHDMHGNIWEWCQDDWHENYIGAPVDGSVWINDNNSSIKVLRGGSWNNDPKECRSAIRVDDYAINRDLNVGFRVVCEMPRT
jgi:formylglycine-generating enzyme required for sulfatase activity